MSGPRRGWTERVVARLLRWYPASFRDAREREVLEYTREELRSRPGLGTSWRIVSDVVIGLYRVRRAPDLHLPNPPMPSARGRGTALMSILHDLRTATRSIRRTPVSSAAVAVTLALGIGLNTAIFSVVYAVLLAPLQYADADRLVVVAADHRAANRTELSVAGGVFAEFQRENASFESIAAAATIRQNLTGVDQSEQLEVGWVSNNFFDVLATPPYLGRYFLPDDGPGRVVLSFGLWQRALGGDASAIGSTVRLDAHPYTVVGVLPPSFRYHISPTAQDIGIWKNPDDWWQNGDVWNRDGMEFGMFRLLGRLRADVTLEQAAAELERRSADLRQRIADYQTADYHLTATPLVERVTRNARPTLVLLLGAVTLVLLIACGNVMNLMLVRGETRRRELATRLALGARRSRIVQLLLTEGGVLATAGGIIGIGIASLAISLLTRFGPRDVPRLDQLGLDGPVVVFAVAVTFGSVILSGLVPAIGAARRDPFTDLRTTGAGAGSRHRLSNALVSLQLAVSLVLLVGAGLLTTSLTRLQSVDPGFDHENLLTFAISLPGARYEWPEQTDRFFRELEDRVRALPGAEGAGVVWPLPMSGSNWSGPYLVEGRDAEDPGDAGYRLVTPDYFETASTQLLDGRHFGRGDPKKTVIISSNLAEQEWPGASAVGRRIDANPWGRGLEPFEVIGVVENVQFDDLREPADPAIYFDSEGWSWADWEVNVAVRTDGDPSALIGPIRDEIAAMDTEIPMAMIQTMDEYIGDRLAAHHFALFLMGTFAVVAAVLAAVGLYGVLTHAVTQRVREIGIRMALGSDHRAVVRLIVGNGLRVAGVGIAIGTAGAILTTRLLESYLFGVSATDPSTFAVFALGLGTVATAASLVPALRATSLDPIAVLRSD